MVRTVVAQFSGQSAPSGGSTVITVPTDGEVAIVRWPSDRASVESLRAQGRPRLLLVEPDEPAPTTTDLTEDWIRLPASEGDLQARSIVLAARAALASPRPVVDGDGRLVHGNDWVALSPIEEALIASLVDNFGEVVALDELASGPDGHELSANAIRVHVMRLRKRILPLGLVVRTIHGRGYLIEQG
jgi:hypothetical protein